jgi:hypothetical protein
MKEPIMFFVSAVAAMSVVAPAEIRVTNPQNFIWVAKEALPEGAYGTVVQGDPNAGEYAFLARFPKGFRVPLHWHSNDVHVLINSGSMRIIGRNGVVRVVEAGGFLTLPARHQYVAECEEGCSFLAYGSKPFDIIYFDPKDDPRLVRR